MGNYVEFLNIIIDCVDKQGWAIMPIFGENVRFCYTIGLWQNYRHPEIIMIGLPMELSSNTLSFAACQVQHSQKVYQPEVEYFEEFFQNSKTIFKPVAKSNYDYYFGMALRYYGNIEVPPLQLFWQNDNGEYPWNTVDFNEQPDLSIDSKGAKDSK